MRLLLWRRRFLFRKGCPVKEVDLSCARADIAGAFRKNSDVEADCCSPVSPSCLALKDADERIKFLVLFTRVWLVTFPRVLSSSRTHLRTTSSSESELSAISKLMFARGRRVLWNVWRCDEDASAQALPDLRKIQWDLFQYLGTRFYCIVGKHFVNSVWVGCWQRTFDCLMRELATLSVMAIGAWPWRAAF